MNDRNSQLADFAADWLEREPILALCHRFASKPLNWLAAVLIIEELLQAMFALSNIELAQAKIAWWADEADLAISGAPRHPLTQMLFAARLDLSALPALVKAALEWTSYPSATDARDQRQQFSKLAAAASKLVNEGNCDAIWSELAAKRQVQSFANANRYGPSVLNRATLAEFQLKSSQLSDAALIGPALAAKLTDIERALRDALPAQAPGLQSATRPYGLLHAREASIWAKLALKPSYEFPASRPGLIDVLKAWWIARI